MNLHTNNLDSSHAAVKAIGSPAKPARRRSKRFRALFSTALIAFLSLGMVAPPAIADEASTQSEYVLNVNGQEAILAEGETAVFGMQLINSTAKSGMLSPNVVYSGNGGTITVTAAGGVYQWSVAMAIPATSFLGAFYVTDLTSGFSNGSVPATKFYGSASTSRLYGHRYSGTLIGKAYFLGVPVSTTGPNNTLYTYP